MSHLPPYCSTLNVPLQNIFESYSIDFAGPLPISKVGRRHLLIAVEDLTGWPIVVATTNLSAVTVANFIEGELMHKFGPQKTTISENGGCFTPTAVADFMKKHGIT